MSIRIPNGGRHYPSQAEAVVLHSFGQLYLKYPERSRERNRIASEASGMLMRICPHWTHRAVRIWFNNNYRKVEIPVKQIEFEIADDETDLIEASSVDFCRIRENDGGDGATGTRKLNSTKSRFTPDEEQEFKEKILCIIQSGVGLTMAMFQKEAMEFHMKTLRAYLSRIYDAHPMDTACIRDEGVRVEPLEKITSIVDLDRIYHLLVDNGLARNFCASRHWAYTIFPRMGLSLHTPHANRRADVDDEFVEKYATVYSEILADASVKVYNMDETGCSYNATPRKVIAPIGGDAPIHSTGNEKENLTILFTISKDGEKLPGFAVARGKTDRCEEKFHIDSVGDGWEMTHSERGWCTTEVMLEYLRWFRQHVDLTAPDEWVYLIVDIYRSHLTDSVCELAKELRIILLFIPANGTSLYQPLDVTIYGPFKLKYKAELQKIISRPGRPRLIAHEDVVEAAKAAWDQIETELVQNAFAEVLSQCSNYI